MDENKLKAIVEEVVNKAVDPIKEDLAGVKQDLAGVKKDLSKIKKTQKDHTGKLEALSGDMEQVLSEVKATHDEIGLWHQRDKREINEIKKHLNLPIISDIPAV